MENENIKNENSEEPVNSEEVKKAKKQEVKAEEKKKNNPSTAQNATDNIVMPSGEHKKKKRRHKNKEAYYGKLYNKYYENSRLIGGNNPNRVPFAVVEAYKNIRIHLISILSEIDGKIVAISSPNAAEGKSTTSVNIAITLSQLGKKVILVDTDMRRATVNKKLRLKNEMGCSDVIEGKVKLEDAVNHYNKSLDVLTSGTITENPSEMFSSAPFDRLLSDLRDIYDYVIIDTPPVNLVSDTLVISQKCDGLVLIARASVTTYADYKSALNTLKQLNIKVLGTIINGDGATKTKYNSYYNYGRYAYYK